MQCKKCVKSSDTIPFATPQVQLFAFDLLYINGKSLVKDPFVQRRARLYEAFREVEGPWAAPCGHMPSRATSCERMCVSVCVCVYVCVCVCLCVCVCMCLCLCLRVATCVDVYVCAVFMHVLCALYMHCLRVYACGHVC